MANASQIERHVLPDADAAARAAAEWLVERALAVEDRPALCLAGGNTPRLVYSMLAEPPFRYRFPWARAHWFFGDERVVPPDSARSNYHMVEEALFGRAPIPRENIHRVPTESGDAEKAALAYEAALKWFYGSERLAANRALFAATLLGVGDDGHTASLFPANGVLNERKRWAVGVRDSSVPEPRVTLTIPTLESSGEVAFLVTGAGKHAIVARLEQDPGLPAARIHPPGRLRWFLDRAAAGNGKQ
jgi:6-phosphogluconolactonase